MKKILFTLHRMNVGGVEKAFLGMLNALPHDDLEVHVAFFVPEGGFIRYLPEWIHLHTIDPLFNNAAFIEHPIKSTIHDLLRLRTGAIPRFAAWVRSKLKGDKSIISHYLLRNDDALGMEFDLAVNYASPHEYLDYYVSHHIKARRRAMWIHFDVSKCFNSSRAIKDTMASADRIFIVSETGRRIFNERFPELTDKTVTFRNIISPEVVKQDALRPSTFRRVEGALNIVTVGRLNPEKGHSLAIAAIARLRAMGITAVLHIVGGGRTEYDCRRQAVESGIDDMVRFYGSQINPYPYMAQADLYLQPSLHEGYCITIAEAKIFEAPIVATDFTGAREQLMSRPNAVIAEDFTPEAIANAIVIAKDLPRCSGDDTCINDMESFLELLKD